MDWEDLLYMSMAMAMEADESGDEPLKIRKIDNVDKHYLLKDKYIPIVEKNYPQNEMKLLRWISAYRDKNNVRLSTIYPYDYPIFGPDDIKILYTSTGVNPEELEDDIKQVKLPDGVEEKANFTPLYTTIVFILHYYAKHKKKERFNIIIRYFSYSIWWSVFSRSIPFVKRPVMEYTINTMNRKFLLKQLGSIDELLFHGTSSAVGVYEPLLLDLFDCSIYYIIDAVKTRLGGYVKNIASKYFKDEKSGNVIMMGADSDQTKESVSGDQDIMSLATAMTTKFFSDRPRRDIVNMVAELAQVSAKELEIVLTFMIDKRNTSEVQTFYECIFYQYLHEDNSDNDLTNKKQFLNRMMAIYKKGHTTNKNDLIIKNLMTKWLNEGSRTYQKTTSGTTQSNYRKAVYFYFVFLVALK